MTHPLGPAALLVLLAGAAAASEDSLPAEVAELSAEERSTWLVRSIREDVPPLEDPLPFLVEAGLEVPDHLVGMVVAWKVPAFGAGGVQTMSIYQHELLRRAFVELGPAVMLAAGRRAIEREDTAASRAVNVELLGLLGENGPPALKEMVRHARKTLDADLDPRIAEAFEVGVADLVEHHPDVHAAMRARWRSWPHELLAPTLRGVGRARDPRGLPFLGDVMAWYDDLAILCMSQLRLLGPSSSADVNAQIGATVRQFLDPDDPRFCQAAALALGDLEDTTSIPELIDLLASGIDGLAENALWSLRRISGLRLNDRAELWRAWYSQEKAWFENDAPRLFQRLSSPRDQDVAAAIREIGKHRLYRDALAREIVTVLEHDESRFRARACRALALLRSQGAIPDLIEALDDADEEVFLEAHAALIQLVGRDLGRDPDDWRSLLVAG
jgi:hypothetical protein